jgi:hypothetical protein
VALEGVIAWGPDDVEGSVDVAPFRDAYLAGYAAAAGDALASATPEDLRAACAIALRLGWVCRAVNAHLHGEDAKSAWLRLGMAFDGHPWVLIERPPSPTPDATPGKPAS